SFTLKERVREIHERFGVIGFLLERRAITLFRAIECAESLVAEPEVVEHGDVARGVLEGSLVMDRGGAVLTALQVTVAEIERRLRVVRIELEDAPPGIARSDRVGGLEHFAQKIPGGDVF